MVPGSTESLRTVREERRGAKERVRFLVEDRPEEEEDKEEEVAARCKVEVMKETRGWLKAALCGFPFRSLSLKMPSNKGGREA